MNFNKWLIYSGFGAIIALSGCTSHRDQVIAQKQAPTDMLQSFSQPGAKDQDACAELNCVQVQKASLGKIFLLIASGKTSGSTPQWLDTKPLVVSFEKSGQRIAILGQNYNSIYNEISTVNLIQTFEIVSEDDTTITFDWGDGLKSFIMQDSMDIDSPASDTDKLTEASSGSVPVEDSFVRNVKFDTKNIELEQISKIMSDKIKADDDPSSKALDVVQREETVDMNIQIRSYDLGANFKKKVADPQKRVGFFVNKVSQEGYANNVVNLITKWDLDPAKGPIVYRVSNAVPADYVDAVKEGVLYWNKVFGREVVTVETGVDEAATPVERTVMIRWINWEDAAMSYAGLQADPMTGEILRGQVFLTSVFTKVASADLLTLNHNSPIVKGGIACDVGDSLKKLAALSQEAPTSQRLRLARDSVRATVAHEVGHTLGLRHNFAGSYSAKASYADIQKSASTYLTDLNHPGLETSTSIMDYVSGIDQVLMSARLKNTPLSYDKMAMDWAYSDNDSALDTSISAYCTDEDMGMAQAQGLQVYGCAQFDAGKNPLQRKVLSAQDTKNQFVGTLFVALIGRMFPADQPTQKVSVQQVVKDLMQFAKADFTDLPYVTQAVMNVVVDGKANPGFASIDNVRKGQLTQSLLGMDTTYQAERDADLKELGGYIAILNGMLRRADGKIDMTWIQDQTQALVASGAMASGTTLGGRAYTLTADEQAYIVSFFQALAQLNNKAVESAMQTLIPVSGAVIQGSDGKPSVISLSLSAGMVDQASADQLTQLFVDLNAASTATVVGHVGTGLATAVTLPARFLTADERSGMVGMLSSTGLSFNQTMNLAKARAAELQQINNLLKQANAAVTDASILKADDQKALAASLVAQGSLDDNAGQWLQDEMQVLQALSSVQ